MPEIAYLPGTSGRNMAEAGKELDQKAGRSGRAYRPA